MLEDIILSEVIEKQNKLFLTLRGLGSVYVNWDHVFPSKILSETQKNKLKKKIEKDNKLKDYKLSNGCKVTNDKSKNVFNILHLKAPLSIKDYLTEEYGDIFITGHYKETMRERFANPGSIVSVDDDLIKALSMVNEFNEKNENIKDRVYKDIAKYKTPYKTRVFNELNKKEFGEDYKEKIVKKAGQKIINEREEIQGLVNEANSLVNTEYSKDRGLEIVLDSINTITVRSPLTYEELMREKWLFLDIEIPNFRKKKPEISWVSMTYYDNEVLKNELHTLSETEKDIINGFTVLTHDSEEVLIDAVKESILKEDPYIISSYNTKFDLLKFRENNDFFIGERESFPLQEASTPFFERVGVRGREVIDLLRWAQITYDYLPNKKLELVSKVLLGGEKFEKTITYNEMEDLEEIARYGRDESDRLTAAAKIASYSTNDTKILIDIFKSGEFQNFLKRGVDIADEFHIPLSWAFYSPRSINLAQKRAYFKSLGIYKDEVYFKSKRARDELSLGKQDFRRLLEEFGEVKAEPGIYENVHLAYLHYGNSLKAILQRRFPEIENFFKLKSEDPSEHYIIGRWGNALAEWITTDLAIYKKKQKGFEKLKKKKGLSDKEFNDVYFNQLKHFRENSDWANSNFFKGRLSLSAFKKHLSEDSEDFLNSKNLNLEELLNLMNKKCKVWKNSNKIEGNYQADVNAIEYLIKQIFSKIKFFKDENNLEVIHQDGPYVYFSGDVDKVKKEHPELFIANFDKVLVTGKDGGKQKLYYKVHNFYKGLKVVDHPTNNLNMFEMQTYGSFLDELLAGNSLDSLQSLYDNSDLLLSNKINNDELIWHSKASDRYAAFEDGEKIYFRKSYDGTSLIDEVTGREYVTETIYGKDRMVYIMDVDKLRPDWALYNSRNKKRINEFLHDIIGEDSDRFTNSIDSNGLINDEEMKSFASCFKTDRK